MKDRDVAFLFKEADEDLELTRNYIRIYGNQIADEEWGVTF